MDIDIITGHIIESSIDLHSRLGPGLLESVYEIVLAERLRHRGYRVQRQHPVQFKFDGMVFDDGLRVDLLVDDTVIVELKSVEKLIPIHFKQTLSYLRLLDLPVGLLINFGAASIKEGLHRIVNGFNPVFESAARPGRALKPTGETPWSRRTRREI